MEPCIAHYPCLHIIHVAIPGSFDAHSRTENDREQYQYVKKKRAIALERTPACCFHSKEVRNRRHVPDNTINWTELYWMSHPWQFYAKVSGACLLVGSRVPVENTHTSI